MPPKVKITKEDIIKTALELIRTSGEQSVNARAIACSLNCSTQPIFSNFINMDALLKEVIKAGYDCYLNFLKREVESEKYPKYKAFGMGYIHFAKEEKELFKLLFMRDRTGEVNEYSPDFEQSVQMIVDTTGISPEKARLMHLEMWTCVHGIATMLVTSFVALDWELISNVLTDVYQGVRARHLTEVGK
ncbi:MAG: TetR/AcrR family transcriptional regulator [Clostridia bacterium]|nr:TetR/AcrR family transcriptional regulator [Clostridia bacterium]